MFNVPYYSAQHGATKFNCPHCNVYSVQNWFKVLGLGINNITYQKQFSNVEIANCQHCDQNSIWLNECLLFPLTRGAPQCNSDLNQNIVDDYEEAALIEHESPRAAAALLRLCIQKMCVQLGEKGKNINEDIENLVRKGLPIEIKQALDVVRVIGNNSVHPGDMNIAENPDTVSALFQLVNSIADRMITQPKKISELHNSLPESVREAIKKRDDKAKA